MVGWDGDQVYTAPEYKTDIEQKTFTLCRADDMPQLNYSMARYRKMIADRYAGWSLVVRPEFEKLFREYTLRETYYTDYDTGELKLRDRVQQLLTPKAR